MFQGHLDVPSKRYAGVSYRLRVGLRIEVICAPGNAGIANDATCLSDLGADDVRGIVAVAKESAVDLVVVGPRID